MPDRSATPTGRLRDLVAGRTGGAGGPATARAAGRWALTWTTLVVVAGVTGVVVAASGKIGLAVAAFILVFGIFVLDPVLLAVVALPASLLLIRVGGASLNLSTADLVVFVAGLACLFQVRWRDARFLKQFLQGIVWYEAVLLLVVLVHPYRYNVLDWFHRWSFMGASVLVGWMIAAGGRQRTAFRAYLYGSALVAMAAMADAVVSHLQPAQFGLYQKNAIGHIMWVAIAVAQINPPWLRIGRREAQVCKYLCIGGLLASFSRQGVIALVVALAVAVVRNPEVRRRSKLMLLAAVPLAVGLYYSFSYAARTNPKFNSVSIRVSQLDAAFHVWRTSPLFGEGMRFYNLPQFVSVTAPPNVFVDNLASTGVVGSLAFLYLVYVTLRTMGRLPVAFGTLGLAVLLAHYVDGLFDIFWIGASSTVPFIVCGVCIGMADSQRARGQPEAEPAATRDGTRRAGERIGERVGRPSRLAAPVHRMPQGTSRIGRQAARWLEPRTEGLVGRRLWPRPALDTG